MRPNIPPRFMLLLAMLEMPCDDPRYGDHGAMLFSPIPLPAFGSRARA